MQEFKVRIGDGNPEINKDFKEAAGGEEEILIRLQGLKGNIRLHLYGKWYERISPSLIQKILVNLECNPKFIATISS